MALAKDAAAASHSSRKGAGKARGHQKVVKTEDGSSGEPTAVVTTTMLAPPPPESAVVTVVSAEPVPDSEEMSSSAELSPSENGTAVNSLVMADRRKQVNRIASQRSRKHKKEQINNLRTKKELLEDEVKRLQVEKRQLEQEVLRLDCLVAEHDRYQCKLVLSSS